MNHILLIDGDVQVHEALKQCFSNEGFNLSPVYNGHQGIQEALSEKHELVLLDLNLPDINGFEVLQEIRKASQIPVIILTGRLAESDRIVGLEIGADDYLTKPFNERELTARIRAVCRRTVKRKQESIHSKLLKVDDITINTDNRAVTVGDKPIELTATEYRILKTLVEHTGVLVSREELTKVALKREMLEHDRAIDMHVSNVRKKTGLKPGGSPRLKTVRGMGYYYI